jgi:SWI/SNF-related matrix-associated actin-dependent regulator 1 of chromatin subfamily A
MQRSRKTVLETKESDILEDDAPPKGRKAPPKKKPAAKKDKKTQYAENSANVLMDLRKASLHPMLFRKRFDDEVLSSIVRTLLKEPDFKKRGATFRDCMEDMEVMTDAEIQHFLMGYKSTNKFLLDEELWHDAAKVTVLLDLLGKYKAQDRKVLIFSQVRLRLRSPMINR